MFKKNDPLVDSVKAVMEQSERDRQIEAAVNEEFGVTSKKALPREVLPAYEQRLAEAKKCAMDEKVDPSKYSPKQKQLAHLGNRTGHGGDPKEIDEPDLKAVRKVGHIEEEEQLDEKAVSKAQHRLMGAAYAAKKTGKAISPKIAEIAKSMSKKELKKFAGTKEKGLPERVDEGSKTIGQAAGSDISGIGSRVKAFGQSLGGSISSGLQQLPAYVDRGASVVADTVGLRNIAKNREAAAQSWEKSGEKSYGAAQERANKTLTGAIKRGDINPKTQMYKEDIEALWEEIRSNLQEQLLSVYESGDEAAFEAFVSSLTEEQCDILGLSEGTLSKEFSNLARSSTKAFDTDAGKLATRAKEIGGTGAEAPKIKDTTVTTSREIKTPDSGPIKTSREVRGPDTTPGTGPKTGYFNKSFADQKLGRGAAPEAKSTTPSATPRDASSIADNVPSASPNGPVADLRNFVKNKYQNYINSKSSKTTTTKTAPEAKKPEAAAPSTTDSMTAKMSQASGKGLGPGEAKLPKSKVPWSQKTAWQKTKTLGKVGTGIAVGGTAALGVIGAMSGKGPASETGKGKSTDSKPNEIKSGPSKVWSGSTPSQVKSMQKHNYRALPKSSSTNDEIMKSLNPRFDMDNPLPSSKKQLKESFEHFLRNKFCTK